jgi:hypothetical protein
VNLQSRLNPWYLIVLWLVLAGVCRLGAPTLAELGGQDHPEAWGLGGMLVTLFVLGVALFFIFGMGYLYQSRPVMLERGEPFQAQPVPQYTSEVERVIVHPDGNDQVGWFLDASPEQWRAVYNLTRTRQGIVFNVIDGEGRAFADHADLDNFRQQMVRAGLAYALGNQVLLNVRGRQMVARYGSPTPPMKGKK